ncbi:MAG: sugar-binding protein, partial [Planctomycetota bacterium]
MWIAATGADAPGGQAASVLSLYQAPEIEAAASIDGRFEDACWKALPAGGAPYDFAASTPQPASIRTAVKLGHDATGIYLAIHNREDQPEKISAARDRDAGGLWRDDSVELYFCAGPGSPTEYRRVSINAAGRHHSELRAKDRPQRGGASHWGVVPAEPGAAGGDAAAGKVQVAVSRDERGWHAEVHIPWERLGAVPEAGDVWRFALVRYSYTKGKRFAASAFGARFNNPDAFGYLYFGEIAPEDGEALDTLSEAVRPPWILSLGERCIRAEADAWEVIDCGDMLRTRKRELADALKRARADLPPPRRTLRQAADRLAKRLAAIPTDRCGPAVLDRRLAALHAIEDKLADLDPAVEVAGPTEDADKGVQVFRVKSPYTRGTNPVEVLLPSDFSTDRTYRVLYVLPVNAGIGGRWGDCLQVIRKAGLHDAHGLICVTMAFDTTPWYGAHATDPAIRHEQYIRDVVVPLIEDRYPARRAPEARLLVGFSKSGWGSFTLLLRNPDVFGYACSWDAPLIMDGDDFGLWG